MGTTSWDCRAFRYGILQDNGKSRKVDHRSIKKNLMYNFNATGYPNPGSEMLEKYLDVDDVQV